MARILSAVLPLFLALVVAQPLSAQDRSYSIDSFSVQLDLTEVGVYRVEEAITFIFEGGEFREGFRSIPTGRLGEIRDVTVESAQAEIREVESRQRGTRHEITWRFPPRAEPITFILRYEVTDALLEEDGQNIIDWDAVGDEWAVPIRDLVVNVTLPQFDLSAEQIRFSPADEGRLDRVNGRWSATFTRGYLEAGVPYRVLVVFPRRLAGAPPPEPVDPRPILLVVFGVLGGAVAGGITLFGWRARPARDRETSGEAPGVPLPTAGYLVHPSFSWGMHTYLALLIDLARRGQITLRRARKDADEDHLEVDIHATPETISTFEAEFLEELEKHESYQAFAAEMGSLHRRQYKPLRERLVRDGVLTDHRQRSRSLLILALVMGLVSAGAGLLTSGMVRAAVLAVGLGLVTALLVTAGKRFGLSARGAAARGEVREWLEQLRRSIEDRWESSPREAGEIMLEHLPWVVLDPHVDGMWMNRMRKAIRKAGADLQLPSWLAAVVGEEDEDDSFSSFLAIYYLVAIASPGGGSASGSGGIGMSGGAGFSGGVGGGGGGVR